MRKHASILALVLLAAAVSGGCDLGLRGGAGAGTVRFAVQRLSPDLLHALGAQGSRSVADGSRTFLVADRVDFRVFDADYNLIESWTAEPGVVAGPNQSSPISELALESGDYVVEVDVYNASNDAGAQLTASGYEPFTVQPTLMTDVHILCTPSAETRVDLEEGAKSPVFTLPATTVVDETQTITQAGSEQWYSFVASTSATTVSIEPALFSQALLVGVAFDATGKYMFGEESAPQARTPGETVAFTLATQPFARYFVAVLELGDQGAANRAFTVQASPSAPPDIPVLPGGSWSNSLSIARGEVRWFFFDAEAGANYAVSWDDSEQGSGAMTADVSVSLYRGNYGDSDRTGIEYIDGRDVAYDRPLLVPAAETGFRAWLRVTGATFGLFKLMAEPDSAPAVAVDEAAYLPGAPNQVRVSGTAEDGDGGYDIFAIHIGLPAKELSWTIPYDELGSVEGDFASWSLSLDAATLGLQVGLPYNFEVWAEDFAACPSETATHPFVLVSTTVEIE